MTEPAGYSGTPLVRKLGLKDGLRALFLDLPESLGWLVETVAFDSVVCAGWHALPAAENLDFIHGFTASRAVLEAHAQNIRRAVAPTGSVWISWPKKASKRPTDVTDQVIRDVLLPTGLVDVKVAAVDEVWSGLKLMIRRELK